MKPKLVLGTLAEDPVVFVRRGVAQNSNTPVPLLVRLNDDADVVVRVLASRKRGEPTPLFSR
jgi:Leucine rich repeat variant